MTMPFSLGIRRHQLLALRVGLSAILLLLIVRQIHFSTITRALGHVDLGLAALGLLVGGVTVLLSAWQWQLVLKGRQIEAGLGTLTALYLLGMTFGQLLPSSVGGDFAKAVYVGRLSGRLADAASATLMARVVGVVALVLTSLPAAILAPLLLPGFSWLPAVIFLTAGLVLLLAFATIQQVDQLLPRGWIQFLRSSRRLRPAGAFTEGFRSLARQPATLVGGLAVSALFYLSSNLNFYIYGQALHITAPFWFYWIAVPLTALATMLPLSLNGYGVRGASFVLLFAVMGVAAAPALGLAFLMEIQMLLFAAAGGFVVLAFRNPRRAMREADAEPLVSAGITTRSIGQEA